MKNLISTIVILLISLNVLNASEFNVDKSKKNKVKFISDTSLEKFEGVTNNIDGYMYWENDLTQNSQLYFEVDLNTLDTGIGLRNRHMRENYLETDKYRFTNFTGKITKAEKSKNGQIDINAEGTISIHGVIQPLSINAVIEMKTDRTYNIKSTFNIKLSDFNIEIPSLMFLKLSELIVVEVNFTVTETNISGS